MIPRAQPIIRIFISIFFGKVFVTPLGPSILFLIAAGRTLARRARVTFNFALLNNESPFES